MPTSLNISYARSTIYINYCRIFLRRIEISRFYHTVIQISSSVGCLYRTASELRNSIAFPWVVCHKIADSLCSLCINDIDVARYVRLSIIINYKTSIRRKSEFMTDATVCVTTLAIVKKSAFAACNVYRIYIILYRTAFCRKNDGRLVLYVKSHQCENNPLSTCQLFRLTALCAEKIKMIISVAFTLKNELAAVPWQECHRSHGMNILVVMLTIKSLYLVSCLGVISIQTLVCLVTVHLYEINLFVVRCPSYVGEISVFRVSYIQIDRLTGLHVIHTYCYLVTCLAGHRIFFGCKSCDACVNINQRIICNHRLVHTIECKALTVIAPEQALIYSELVAMNTLSVHNVA